MAFDPGTGQLVLFGGTYPGANLNDTWTWNGTTWTQLSPASSPSPRGYSSMAYDPGTGQLVLFGGSTATAFVNDTWTWNGTTWTQQFPATSPPVFHNASMAYDSSTGQLVLVGDTGMVGGPSPTWTWNGTTWTQQSPPTNLPDRTSASMAYDPGTGQLVLFGGQDPVGAYLNDTWTWNGTTWTQQSPATSPPVRATAPMAYDVGTGQLVLFGGYGTNANTGISTLYNDTWTWNGTTWTQQSPATSPPARDYVPMAYDPGTGQLVLFGGSGNGGFLNDTWTYGVVISTATTLTLTKSVVYGDEGLASFNVKVAAKGGTPIGKVTITSFAGTLCTITLSGGSGHCSLASTQLAAGTYTSVFADYGANGSFAGSSSTPAKSFSIAKDSTTTKVSESPTSVTHGNESATVFSATVTTHYGEAVLNGNKVTVNVGPTSCTVTLSGGKGSCRIGNAALAMGAYSVSATYSGDASLSGSHGLSGSKLTVKS
jgi:hypothetical protein